MRGEGDMAKLEDRPSRQDVVEDRNGSRTKRLPSIGETMGSRIVEDVYAAAKPGARNPEGRDVWERLYPKIDIDENPLNRKFRQEFLNQGKKPTKPRSQPPKNNRTKKPVETGGRSDGKVFGRLYGGKDEPLRFDELGKRPAPIVKAKPKPKPALKNAGLKKGKVQSVAAPPGRGRPPRKALPTDKDVFIRLYRKGTPRSHAFKHDNVDGKGPPARKGTDNRRSKSMDPPKKKTVTFLPASYVDEPTRTLPRRGHGVGPSTPHSNFGFLDRRASQSETNVHDLDFADLRRESFTILSLNTPVGIGDGMPKERRTPRSRGLTGLSHSPRSSSSERSKPGRWSKRPSSQKFRSASNQSRSNRSSSVRRLTPPSTEDEDDMYKSDFESSGSDVAPSRSQNRARSLSRNKSRPASPSTTRAASRRATPSKGRVGAVSSSSSSRKGTPSRASRIASRRSFRVLSRTSQHSNDGASPKQSVLPVYNTDAIRPNTGPASYLDSYLNSYQTKGGETNIYSLEEERRQNLRNLNTGGRGTASSDDLKLPDIRRQDSAYLSDRDNDLNRIGLHNNSSYPLQQRQAAGHDSGRHTKRASAEKKRQKGIFTASEEKPPTNIKEVDYDKDEGGVYRSKSQNTATLNATEIKDSEDTVVDLPLDLKVAEEVKDEEIMTEPLKKSIELQNTTLDDNTAMVPASQPCLEVEVDEKGDIQEITEDVSVASTSTMDLHRHKVNQSPLRQWTSRLPVYQTVSRTPSLRKEETKPRFELPFLWQKTKTEDYVTQTRQQSPLPTNVSAEYPDHTIERTSTPSTPPEGTSSDAEEGASKADWYDNNYQTNVCIAAASSDAAAERLSYIMNSPTLSLGYEPKILSPLSPDQDESPFTASWTPTEPHELPDKNCSGDAFTEDTTPRTLHYPYEFTSPYARRSLKSSAEIEIEKHSPKGGTLSYFTPRDIHSEYPTRPGSGSSETSSLFSNRTFNGSAKNRRNADNKRDSEEPFLPKVQSVEDRNSLLKESPSDFVPTHDKPFDPFYDSNTRWTNMHSPIGGRDRLTPIETNATDQSRSVTPRLKSSRERLRASMSLDGERSRQTRSPALRTSESSTHNLLLLRDNGPLSKENKSFDQSLFFTPRDSPRSKDSNSVVLSFPTFGDENYREEAEPSLAEKKSSPSKADLSSATTPRAHGSTKEKGIFKGNSPAFDPFAMFNEEVEKQDKVNAKCNIPILVGKGSETTRAKLQRLIKSAQMSRQMERNLNTSIVRNHLTIQSDRSNCHDEGVGSPQPLEIPNSGMSWSKLSLPDIRKSPGGGAEYLLGNSGMISDKITDVPSTELHLRREKNHGASDAMITEVARKTDSDRGQLSALESQHTANRSVDV